VIVDVILPTFNREALLARTLRSLAAARVPAGMTARVTVVDNASTDGTRTLVREWMPRFGGRLHYLFVATPGKPHALNAGIAATDGHLVGLIDDDEEIDAAWFETIGREFDDGTDFIGGKCLPNWEAPRPAWLGQRYLGVIGWVDPGPEPRPMDASYPGILMGGNAVIRRALLERAGPYSTALSRTGARLLGCEDEDMYHRLLALGARGRYVPDLVIYHHVPAARLTRRYFRSWCFWRGVSLGVMERDRRTPVPHLLGVPRYRIGAAIRAAAARIVRPLAGSRAYGDAERFEDELACWDLAGLAWGRHFHRAGTAAAPVPAATAVDREHLA
jgi:glucosyl-dolichyl phosphate glucuronosyltransferase